MERQGLSGNNSHQQKPSQTIWARTLWWMRWALRFHLPQVPLVSNPQPLCRPVSPFTSIPLTMLDWVSQSTLLRQPLSKPNRPTKTDNGQSHHSQILNEERQCTRVSEIISHFNSQSPWGDKRDHGFESIGTGSWPSPLADPWGGLLRHNGGPGQSLSLDDNTDPALSSTGGWGDKSYFK